MVTLRWNQEIRFIMAFLRVGANGLVNDNAATGGLCVGICQDGELDSCAFDKVGRKHRKHPSTGFDFQNKKIRIPNYQKFKDFVISLHTDILFHDLVSWDIAVGEDNLPFFIEHNFAGQFWIYQLATGQPLFGDLSGEILPFVIEQDKKIKRSTPTLMSKAWKYFKPRLLR